MRILSLTKMEIKIIDSLKKGLSNKQISEENNISVNTVKYHLKKIFHKLSASSRLDAIIKLNNLNKNTEI